MMNKLDETTQKEFQVAYEIIAGEFGSNLRRDVKTQKEADNATAAALSSAIELHLAEMLDGDRASLEDFISLREACLQRLQEQRKHLAHAQAKLDQIEAGTSILHLVLHEIMKDKKKDIFQTPFGTFERMTDYRSDTYRITDQSVLSSRYERVQCDAVIDHVMLKLDLEAGVQIEGIEPVERTEVLHFHQGNS